MEKNKNKKKLFAIIGASALAFVLTIALSVSITLAYFGGKGTGTSTVTLGGSVAVGETLTMTGAVNNAVPGQTVDISIGSAITSSSNQKAAVLILVKQIASGEGKADATINGVTGWTKLTKAATMGTDTYTVYLYGTEDALTVVDASKDNTTVTALTGTYTISTDLKNDAADKAVADAQIDAVMVAIQNGTGSADGEKPDRNATHSLAQLKDIFEEVGQFSFGA